MGEVATTELTAGKTEAFSEAVATAEPADPCC